MMPFLINLSLYTLKVLISKLALARNVSFLIGDSSIIARRSSCSLELNPENNLSYT